MRVHLLASLLAVVCAASLVGGDGSAPVAYDGAALGPVVADDPKGGFAVRAPLPSTVFVRAVGLRPGRRYEARVSYLGSPAAKYRLEVVVPSTADDGNRNNEGNADRDRGVPSQRRELLDTEKTFIETTDVHFASPARAAATDHGANDDEAAAEVPPVAARLGEVLLRVHVRDAAPEAREVLRQRQRLQADGKSSEPAAKPFEAHFIVTVESLVGGAVPRTALPLVAVVLVALAFAYIVAAQKLIVALKSLAGAPRQDAATKAS